MSKENYEKSANDEQTRTPAANGPSASENTLVIRRPRPGSVVILAPPGTPVSVAGTEDYVKVVLLEIPGDDGGCA